MVYNPLRYGVFMENERDKHYLIAEEPCGFMEDEEEITKRVKGVNREKPEWMRIIMKALEERERHNRQILQSQGL